MAFKLNTPPYDNDSTPIYSVDLGGMVLGKANNNGSILVDINIKPKDKEKVIDHEMVHIDQFKRGDLDYDDKNVYWKNKTYPRSKMQEGAKDLPWEKEAYNKTKK
tara:strand:+ start:372 stop:686 length:315 start_codon:yes stop_codon:yes gene_type:complete